MVARIWHGVTPIAKADAYEEYVRKTGIDDVRATPGNRGVFLLRQDNGERTRFLLLSFWESSEAIRRFAGHDVGKARYYPEDTCYLLELEPTVQHYEVVFPKHAWVAGEEESRLC